MRPPGALLLALLLAVPSVTFSQAPPPEGTGIAGNWAGFARLTNDWPQHLCRYTGSNEESSVRLEISSEEGRLQGSVAIDLDPAEGSGCPPLRKRFLITEVVQAESTVSLTDSGGHDWDLSLVRDGRGLQGMMAWQQGAADEPLADGFAFADGTKPSSRLSGEIRLRKVKETTDDAGAGEAEAGSGEGGSSGSKTTSGGDYVKHVGAILGATAVGLGGLYAVNKYGSGSSEEGTITCSPRRCVVGAPGEPCFCEGNVVSGSDCGETETGVPIGEACVWPNRPCQALLSCNSGFCEDRFGFCPFTGGPGGVSALPGR